MNVWPRVLKAEIDAEQLGVIHETHVKVPVGTRVCSVRLGAWYGLVDGVSRREWEFMTISEEERDGHLVRASRQIYSSRERPRFAEPSRTARILSVEWSEQSRYRTTRRLLDPQPEKLKGHCQLASWRAWARGGEILAWPLPEELQPPKQTATQTT